MRISTFTYFLVAAFVSGCDPGGQLRLQLQLHNPPSDSTNVTIVSADTQEALQTIDTIFVRDGFQLVNNYTNQSDHGYIRLYSRSFIQPMADGQVYAQTIPCHVKLIPTGLKITFGEVGFLAVNPAKNIFEDMRSALIKKYGKQNVMSHQLGGDTPD
jgi:hypothetical protein